VVRPVVRVHDGRAAQHTDLLAEFGRASRDLENRTPGADKAEYQWSRAVSLPPLLEGNGFVRNSDLYGTKVIPTSRALCDSEPGSAA